MVFSSMTFLWLFLPVVFLVNSFLKPRVSNVFLLIVSLLFYAWGEPIYVFLMLFSILFNWLVAKIVTRVKRGRGWVLAIGVLTDLGLLGVFKYLTFLLNIWSRLFPQAPTFSLSIALPIGISFYTFQAISFITDVYRGKVDAGEIKLLNTALYISYFPQLIAGPILQYREINAQIEDRSVSLDKVAAGFRRFIYGLAKKVLIANQLGSFVDTAFGLPDTSIGGLYIWLSVIAYALQIYYDFSGYSDMAIGLGKMFGFDIPENFNYPYLAHSITEFWRRWHISLGAWFREYVYIPLGGNRDGTFHTCVNLFCVFFLTGAWHGAGIHFFLWGIYNAFFIILERVWIGKFLDRHKTVGRLYSLFVVLVGWAIFKSSNTHNALSRVLAMFLPRIFAGQTTLPILTQYVGPLFWIVFACGVLGAGLLQTLVPVKLRKKWKGSFPEWIFCTLLLGLSLILLGASSYNPFIYFQF